MSGAGPERQVGSELAPFAEAALGDSPDLAAAKRLLDNAKAAGFAFERIALGEEGPLRGMRQCDEWVDEIHLAGLGSRTPVARSGADATR